MTTLSIIIVNFNTKKLTHACIESIYKWQPRFNFEVIVVDNNSKDGSIKVLESLRGKYQNLKIIGNKENLGYAKANNQGIKHAGGKFTLLLNSDTIVKKGALDALVDFAQNTADAGVVGTRLLNTDGTLQRSCYNFPSVTNAIREYWLGKRGLFEKFAPKGDMPVKVDAVVGAAFLITPQARKTVGFLDERYWAYFEDIDYCRQVWRKGLKVYYLPGSEIVHRHGASFSKLADEDNQWRKLIPSSKIYHGVVKHYILTLVILLGTKWATIYGHNKQK